MKLRSARTFLVLAVVLLFSHSQSVFAASITVNATCSLESAITAANTDTAGGGCPAGSGADTITLTNDITLNLTLPFITSDITIDGGGYIISGDDIGRIFNHTSGHLVVQNATLTKGNAGTGNGGAINSTSDLTLNNVQLTSNTASNTVSRGGAIWMSGGTLTINSSVISNNTATVTGGGIYASGTTAIENSAIYDNSTTTGTGGIYHTGGNLTIKNSTMYGNTGTSAGALLTGLPASATRTLTHVTITNNTSASGWAALTLASNSHEIAVENSIIYGNTGGDCHNATLTGSVNSIIGARTSTCTGGTNITTNDPLLPASASGSPPYFELPAGSPALTAGDDTVCAATPTDQRGASRPATGCDLGAYERDPTTEPTMIPSPTPRPDREDVVLFTIGDLDITYNMIFGPVTPGFYPGISPAGQRELAQYLLAGGVTLLRDGSLAVLDFGKYVTSRLICISIDFLAETATELVLDHVLTLHNLQILASSLGFTVGSTTGGATGGAAGIAGGPAAPLTVPTGAAAGGAILGVIEGYFAANVVPKILIDFLLEPILDDLATYLQNNLNLPGGTFTIGVMSDFTEALLEEFIKGGRLSAGTIIRALAAATGEEITADAAKGIFDFIFSFLGKKPLDCGFLPIIDELKERFDAATSDIGPLLMPIFQILVREHLDDVRYLTEDPRAKLRRYASFFDELETLGTTIDLRDEEDVQSLQKLVCEFPDARVILAGFDQQSALLLGPGVLFLNPSELLCNPTTASIAVGILNVICDSHPLIKLHIAHSPYSPTLLACLDIRDFIPATSSGLDVTETYEVTWEAVLGVTRYVLGVRSFSSPASAWEDIIVDGTSYQLTTNELPRSASGFQLRLRSLHGVYESEALLYPADPSDPTLFAAAPAIVIGANVPLAPQKARRGSTTVSAVAATPRVSTCEHLPANFAVIGYNASTQCNVLDGGGVGKPNLAANFIAALDVWGYLAAGVEVCIQGSGSMWFLDAAHSPRTESTLQAYSWAGMTCVWLDRPGSVVLVPGPAAPLKPTPGPPTTRLNDCMVTLTHVLKFREGPGGAVRMVQLVEGELEFWIPAFVKLTAFERTAHWFKVDYHGERGWISADYIVPSGNCG